MIMVGSGWTDQFISLCFTPAPGAERAGCFASRFYLFCRNMLQV